VRVTLYQARGFARWRFCRLPRLDEWEYAATGRGGYDYPWGNRFEPAWVNEAELGLGRTTPVGTFESGRDDEGAYDLLGNAAEWTESVDPRWFSMEPTTPPHDLPLAALDLLNGMEALEPWRVDGLPWPGPWWVAAAGADLPRLVVGGHFLSLLRLQKETADPGAWRLDGDGWLWERGMGERGDTVGIRLATDPAALLEALAREPDRPTQRELARLRAFLRRPEVAEVLAPALEARWPWAGPAGPVLDVLRQELAP
jgi:hypothetical protein